MRKVFFCSLLIFYALSLFAELNTSPQDSPAPEETIVIIENTEEPENAFQLKVIDIKVIEHDLIDYYKKQYLTDSAKKWLSGVMTAAAPYRAYVIKELKAHNLPVCLQYLPVIESSYKLTALSKSGAAGMWQFMKTALHPLIYG